MYVLPRTACINYSHSFPLEAYIVLLAQQPKAKDSKSAWITSYFFASWTIADVMGGTMYKHVFRNLIMPNLGGMKTIYDFDFGKLLHEISLFLFTNAISGI